MQKSGFSRSSNEQLLNVNMIAVVTICCIYAGLQLLAPRLDIAALIIGMGLTLTLVLRVLRERIPYEWRVITICVCEYLIIFIIGATIGTLHELFVLCLAAVAMSCIYFNTKPLIWLIVVINATLLLALFFRDDLYGHATNMLIIKGIAGINVGWAFLFIVVKWGKESIRQASVKSIESENLLVTVQEKMNETDRLLSTQAQILAQVKQCSEDVSSVAAKMTDTHQRIHAGINAQSEALASLTDAMRNFIEHITETADVAQKAQITLAKAGDAVQEGAQEMNDMREAMDAINSESTRISNIIKDIDGIAFQTNMLALNASVEAARAGRDGLGFAVVANEVRGLANRSADSAHNTALLVDKVHASIARGIHIVESATDTFERVVQTERQSSDNMQEIIRMAQSQHDSISSLDDAINRIAQVVAQNNAIVDESDAIAQQLMDHADALSGIVHNA